MWPWHAALFFSSPSMQTVVLLLKLSPSSQLQPSLWITLSSSFLTHRTSFTVSTGTILNHYHQKQSMCLTGWGWGREGFHSYCSDIGKGEEREDTLSCLKRKQYAVSGLWKKKRSCQGWYIMEQRYHLENKTAARWLGVWNAKSSFIEWKSVITSLYFSSKLNWLLEAQPPFLESVSIGKCVSHESNLLMIRCFENSHL